MIHYHARNDFINLSFVYVCAILAILMLSQVSAPKESLQFGIIAPLQKKQISSIYNNKVFDKVSVIARAYVVYDIVDGKVVASKNINEVLPLASLTKIMTAVTAIKHHDESTQIKIVPTSLDGDYDLGLKKNQIWKLSEVLKYTLVFSSNDGAQEIADGLGGRNSFVSQMNQEAVLLGLTTLHFTHPAGLDVDGKIGGTGTVLDIAKLFAVAHSLFPDILDATTKNRVTVTASTGKVIGIPNTNQEIIDLLGVEASKTGFTNIAGGNLAVIVDVTVGHPVVIVVLGSTREERFSDMKILYNALLKSVKD